MSKTMPTLIILLVSILSGCSKGEASLVEGRSQPPQVVVSTTPFNSNQDDATTHVLKGGGSLCEAHLLKEVSKERAVGNQLKKLDAFEQNNKVISNDLGRWLEIANKETLAAHELQFGEKRALLLNATHIHATGLATSFQYWFVGLDGQHIEFLSQSKNPNLIFFGKDEMLSYYAVDFSDKFLMNKDWSNVTLNLSRYRLDADGNSHLVTEERNVKCE